MFASHGPSVSHPGQLQSLLVLRPTRCPAAQRGVGQSALERPWAQRERLPGHRAAGGLGAARGRAGIVPDRIARMAGRACATAARAPAVGGFAGFPPPIAQRPLLGRRAVSTVLYRPVFDGRTPSRRSGQSAPYRRSGRAGARTGDRPGVCRPGSGRAGGAVARRRQGGRISAACRWQLGDERPRATHWSSHHRHRMGGRRHRPLAHPPACRTRDGAAAHSGRCCACPGVDGPARAANPGSGTALAGRPALRDGRSHAAIIAQRGRLGRLSQALGTATLSGGSARTSVRAFVKHGMARVWEWNEVAGRCGACGQPPTGGRAVGRRQAVHKLPAQGRSVGGYGPFLTSMDIVIT